MAEPREDWTPDSEGSSWAAESTYDDRVARARAKEAARTGRTVARERIADIFRRNARDDRERE